MLWIPVLFLTRTWYHGQVIFTLVCQRVLSSFEPRVIVLLQEADTGLSHYHAMSS